MEMPHRDYQLHAFNQMKVENFTHIVFLFNKGNMGSKDTRNLHQTLSVYSLKNNPYKNEKSFWDTITSFLHKMYYYFPSLFGLAYKKMGKLGWINVTNLDDVVYKFHTKMFQILHKHFSHATLPLNRHPSSFHMVLKSYDTITFYSVVSSYIMYVVLNKNTNSTTPDVNEGMMV
jgi:hypothetical protein